MPFTPAPACSSSCSSLFSLQRSRRCPLSPQSSHRKSSSMPPVKSLRHLEYSSRIGAPPSLRPTPRPSNFHVIIYPLYLSTEECALIEFYDHRIISLIFQTFLFGLTIARLLITAREHTHGSCRSTWNMSSIIHQFLRDGTWSFALIFGAHLVLPALRDTRMIII